VGEEPSTSDGKYRPFGDGEPLHRTFSAKLGGGLQAACNSLAGDLICRVAKRIRFDLSDGRFDSDLSRAPKGRRESNQESIKSPLQTI